MSRRTNRLTAQLSAFVQQCGKKAQRGVEPNDRRYSREAEESISHLRPEELSALLNPETDERLPIVEKKRNKLFGLVGEKRKPGV